MPGPEPNGWSRLPHLADPARPPPWTPAVNWAGAGTRDGADANMEGQGGQAPGLQLLMHSHFASGLVFAISSAAVLLGLLALGFHALIMARHPADEETMPKQANDRAKGRAGPPSRSRAARRRRAQRPADLLPADATVTFAAERSAADIDEVFAGLDRDLVGLVTVKRKVQEIGALLLVDRARRRFGLEAPRPNLHMCFTGPPGTGKTTVALRMAEMLHRLGYLEQGHLVHAMRDDLVGQFVGQTAPRTKRVLDRAMGGVLFIDEAYYLYRDRDSRDYGQEVIDILLQVMENDRDKLVVILAGYKDRMDNFFTSNPGMSSRIAHHLNFAAYELDELVAIGQAMLEQASYYLSEDAESVFRDYLTWQMSEPDFGNARSVRNELEQARLRHAHRLASDPHRNWTRDDLMRLESADILTRPAAWPRPLAHPPGTSR
jgi:probable Rubsico expression protein CbbX